MWAPSGYLTVVLVVTAVLDTASAAWYDTYSGNQVTDERVTELRANGLIPYCAMEIKECSEHEPRRLDYSCNNLHRPSRGAVLSPYYRMLPSEYAANGGPRVSKSGQELPNARALRVALVPDGRVPSKKFTHMVTNMNVFIIGDSTSVHDTINYVAVTRTCCGPEGDKDPRCIPIKVANDDVHLRRSSVRCLNLTRAFTYQRLGCVPSTLPGDRINLSAPMLELSNVYGSEEQRARASRKGEGGQLTSESIKGKEWPPSGSRVCVNNNRNEKRCHNSGDAGSNSLLGINIIYIWFFRNHNYIARKLQEVNPCWDDDKVYTVAKEINIASEQQIVYYELMPAVIGHDYLVKNKVIFPNHEHVDDYDASLDPQVSLEYVLSTRWFHTLQEGRLNLYDRHGKIFNQLFIVDMTLRTGALLNNNTIEGCTQGAFRQPCMSNDYTMDPDMGERSLGRLQFASDVMAADIMKTRDVGLPPYNSYRKLCKLPVAKDFHDLYNWMPKAQVEALLMAYEDVEDIDLMAGMIAEKPMPGAVMGPTLACIMTEQLLRWRRADRFWYERSERPNAFTKEQLQEIRKMTTAKLLCDHGDSVEAVQPNVFYLPGPGNDIIDCSAYPKLKFEAWRDKSCYKEEHEEKKLEELAWWHIY